MNTIFLTSKLSSHVKRVIFAIVGFTLVCGVLRSTSTVAASSATDQHANPASPEVNTTIYLPLAQRDYSNKFVMLGIYPQGYTGNQYVVDTELRALDAWASPGAAISIAASFALLEDNPDWDIPHRLEMLWSNGYTPLFNLSTTHSASQIANGAIDTQVRTWANTFKAWADQGDGRFAYLAPMPEMNGSWVVWGNDPANFKLAFARLHQIFIEQGVSENAARWVFAPNGWNKSGTSGFEAYYPGDDLVDVVGFSGYNFGYHPYSPSQDWQPPLEVYNNPYYAPPEGLYLDRMSALAPTKPIFILQTGTTAIYATGESTNRKNQWLRDAYSYLSNYPGVRAIIYFNLVNEEGIDWPFFVPGDVAHQYQGYRDAVADSIFRYVSPQELSQIELVP